MEPLIFSKLKIAFVAAAVAGIAGLLLGARILQGAGSTIYHSLTFDAFSASNPSPPHILKWDIPPLQPVFMHMENSVHYKFNTDIGAKEWEALLPPSDWAIRQSNNSTEYTISMFHQLECLNIIRQSLVVFRSRATSDPPQFPDKLTHHCMDYLRQMVLCRANIDLESVRNHIGPRLAVSDITHKCWDWTAVYSASEQNYPHL
ncbi:hypothetical protein D9757_011900 [Collybiopsis confluens]|uniref:Uncharacterized protein n=1 Tax=Collybiopsis confluens TaxID=2823264 RepID=A0A8H5GG63_9AGAR|nr:hypothetical protein D9757_011900 [Collybiopsis confluens]